VCNAGTLHRTFDITTQYFAMPVHLSQLALRITTINTANDYAFQPLAFARLHRKIIFQHKHLLYTAEMEQSALRYKGAQRISRLARVIKLGCLNVTKSNKNDLILCKKATNYV